MAEMPREVASMESHQIDRRTCIAGVAAVACLGGYGASAAEAGGVSNAFSNRAHLFVHPQHKDKLTWCFTTILGAREPMSLPVPGLAEPMLAFSFPGGGSVSVEFTKDALDEQRARFGAWLEVRTPEPQALRDKILAAGLPQVHYPYTTTFYFAAPGGQVIGILGTDPKAISNEIK
jgi:hypothetical protein